MLNFTSTNTNATGGVTTSSGITDPTRAPQAPEWQVIQRGSGKANATKKKEKKKEKEKEEKEKGNERNRTGMGEQSSHAPSLCDILDSPEPKNTASKEDLNGQVIIRRGTGTSMSIDMGKGGEEDSRGKGSTSMSMTMDKEGKGAGHKRKRRGERERGAEEREGECLELRLRIEELESLIKNGREECEEARREAARAKKENEELFAGYERLKQTYFVSLLEAVKADVSPKSVSFKRRRATRTQWGDLGAGAEQRAEDLFAEATFEGVEPCDYPGWISNKLSSTKSGSK